MYWHERLEGTVYEGKAHDELVRYDVSTGTRAPASQADYRAETRTTPPMLVVGSADSSARLSKTSSSSTHGSRATPGAARLLRSSWPRPANACASALPDGYDGESLYVFQWLDDDQFALVVSVGVGNVPTGDLLVCRISAGECRTVASGEQYWLLPGPFGGVGAEG